MQKRRGGNFLATNCANDSKGPHSVNRLAFFRTCSRSASAATASPARRGVLQPSSRLFFRACADLTREGGATLFPPFCPSNTCKIPRSFLSFSNNFGKIRRLPAILWDFPHLRGDAFDQLEIGCIILDTHIIHTHTRLSACYLNMLSENHVI